MSFSDTMSHGGQRGPRLEIRGSVASSPPPDGHFRINNEKEQLINIDDPMPYTVSDLPAFDPESTLTDPAEVGRSFASSYSSSGPYHCHVVRTHTSAKATKQLIIVSCLCTLFLAAELTGKCCIMKTSWHGSTFSALLVLCAGNVGYRWIQVQYRGVCDMSLLSWINFWRNSRVSCE